MQVTPWLLPPSLHSFAWTRSPYRQLRMLWSAPGPELMPEIMPDIMPDRLSVECHKECQSIYARKNVRIYIYYIYICHIYIYMSIYTSRSYARNFVKTICQGGDHSKQSNFYVKLGLELGSWVLCVTCLWRRRFGFYLEIHKQLPQKSRMYSMQNST